MYKVKTKKKIKFVLKYLKEIKRIRIKILVNKSMVLSRF